eukprot:SAG22_NODE_8364_length_661_cov_1.364769_1_plen_173_part_00
MAAAEAGGRWPPSDEQCDCLGETDSLRVVVEKAKGLLPMDKGSRTSDGAGSSDPYAQLGWVCSESAGQKKATTPHIKKTLRPDWLALPDGGSGGSGQSGAARSTFLLQLRRGAALHIGVWDHDFGPSDDFIGGALLDTAQLPYRGQQQEGGSAGASGWRGWVELFTADTADP